MIDGFIANEFLQDVGEKETQKYKTTVAIAELLFSFGTELKPIDGLAYPTIAGRWTHANVALLPDACYRLYKPISCQRIKVIGSLPNLGFSLDPNVGLMAIGINDNGDIAWP